MSSPSCVSHDDSTSICVADASLDIRFAFDMALRARYALPNGQRERSNKVRRNRLSLSQATYRISSVARNISIAHNASKYRVAKQHIDKK